MWWVNKKKLYTCLKTFNGNFWKYIQSQFTNIYYKIWTVSSQKHPPLGSKTTQIADLSEKKKKVK